MIEKGDIQKLTEISKNVFLKQIETYPLIVQIRRWLEVFTEEIADLRNRVQILEAEVDLLRRSRGIKAAETTASKKAQAIQCSLTPEIIGQIRMAFACNIDQMARILEVSTKHYHDIERGNITPSLALETKILKMRYMTATERREILQAHGLFRTKTRQLHAPGIPHPPDTPEIRMTIAELQDIKAKLNVTKPQLAKLVGVSHGQVSGWLNGSSQPSEEYCQKLRSLSADAAKSLPECGSPMKTIQPKVTITPEQLSEILQQLNWTIPQLAAYLHVAEYKAWGWKNGHSSPSTQQANKLKDLQDKIKRQEYEKTPVTIDEFMALKEKMQYSDYHLSIILKVSYVKVHSWSLGISAPTLNESVKIRKLHTQVFSGTFVDNIQLPRISAEKITELRKRQNLRVKDFIRVMGIMEKTYDRWMRGKRGPSQEENERLWILWEKPVFVPPPVLSGKEIFEIRKNHKLSQDKFGEMLGQTGKKVSRWELGITDVPVGISEKIKTIFNLQSIEESENDKK